MLNQVGDTVQISVGTVAGSGSIIYSYVWGWWDGSVSATTTPFVTKVLNSGGNPANDHLGYTCQPVAVDGQSTVIYGTLTVNNPPVILPGAAISVNDTYYPFATTVKLSAFDFEGDLISYAWYEGALFLGNGSTVSAGMTSGTWAANGSTAIGSYAAYTNSFLASVPNDRTITCYVMDNRGGTTTLDFSLRGEPAPAVAASINAATTGLTLDASTLPSAVIGAGQTFDFTVFVNPIPNTIVSFAWDFSGSNGWTAPPSSSAGTTTNLSDGVFQNTVQRDISAEVIASGTSKVVTTDVQVTAYNYVTTQTTRTELQTSVVLTTNLPPSAVSVARSVAGAPVNGVGPVTPGDLILFSATGTDSNASLLSYAWQFNQPFVPLTLYLYGPKVVYDTGGYTGTNIVQGQLTVTDPLGAARTVILPVTSFN